MSSFDSIPIQTAMLMAAGLGTRMLPFTRFQTKALLPVMGVPVAQYAIDSLVAAGVRQIVANVHHQGGQATEGMLSLEYGASRLIISDESQKLLGSAGGIRKALRHFGGGAFFLANADVLCDVNWSELAACHQRLRSNSGVLLTLAVFSGGPPGGKYREIYFNPATQLITGLGELIEGRPFFVGAAVLEPEALSSVPDGVQSDFVHSILNPAISEGRAGVFVSQGRWLDIGEPQLWLKTHLALMEMIERDQCKEGTPSGLWRARIEKENVQLSPGIWASRDLSRSASPYGISPCYWNPGFKLGGGQGDGLTVTRVPQQFGPEAVLYGPCVEGQRYFQGIGLGGQWVEFV